MNSDWKKLTLFPSGYPERWVSKNIDSNYTIGYTDFQFGGITHGKYKDCNIN